MRFGVAFVAMTLGFVLVSALMFLAWLTDRPVLLWPALVVSVVFASGLSLSAIRRATPVIPGSRSSRTGRISCGGGLVGGLVQLAFVVWPLAPELRRDTFLRFSRLERC